MKFNSPLPQTLPRECSKAAQIFKSFVDSGNNGLDGIIPRSVLEHAKGFAIFTVFKAGFLFSARAGSGVVIAKLQDGTWSAPSAIGTAGVGFGGQAGAEVTDFLLVLNSRAAVASFMAAGSLTIGGNLSVAVGPLGRNGEALGSVNTKGKVAAMYTYSKTRGLFGGVSLEGSVIVERQDANAQAYRSDVSAKTLLSGQVPPPEWADSFIRTLESCTGLPGNRQWFDEQARRSGDSYLFGGVESPRNENGSNRKRPGLGSRNDSNDKSSFDHYEDSTQQKGTTGRSRSATQPSSTPRRTFDEPTTDYFGTRFESDFNPNEEEPRKTPRFSTGNSPFRSNGYPFQSNSSDASSHKRSVSAYTPSSSLRFKKKTNPFEQDSGYGGRPSFDYDDDLDQDRDVFGAPLSQPLTPSTPPKLEPKAELTRPLQPHEGVARAIALYDFKAVQPGDLSFTKGQVITVTEMSKTTDTWWTGKVEGRTGIFPANFVEVV
ncbi:hypothetical protein BDY19DRAFT_997485 [Irpex rosettiformis]|uniref:Uncharacterized protein n=1 Tax=Irpex rosettiformis TaxID=378272 RepID=A0ACB8TRT5_9APHY|nr:hypothetical protein BDY19DRAFT_997485 [Irpex rosettiformis]